MQTIQEFREVLLLNLRNKFNDMEFSTVDVVKTNDTVLYAITYFITPCCQASLYVNNYFERYIAGVEDIPAIVETISNGILKELDTRMSKVVGLNFSDPNFSKECVCFRLINFEWNKAYLEDKPYTKFCDFAVIFYLMLEDVSDITDWWPTITVTKSLMELWGFTTQELFQLALENTPRLLPAVMKPMEDVMQNVLNKLQVDMSLDEFNTGMHIASNRLIHDGAAVMLYKGFLADCARQLDDEDLVIIPSSVHEVLLMPYRKSAQRLSGLSSIICSVNRDEVLSHDRLSDKPYIYNALTDKITPYIEY